MNGKLIAQGVQGMSSMIKTRALRRDRLSDTQVDQRLGICRSCPGGHVVLKRNGLPLSCGKLLSGEKNSHKGRPCGCLLRQKARDALQDCPFGYWPQIKLEALETAGQKTGTQEELDTKDETGTQEPIVSQERAQNGTGRVRFFLDVGAIRQRKRTQRIASEPPKPLQVPQTESSTKRSVVGTSTRGLFKFFDRVYVVNLDRRQDRLTQLQSHLADIGWPFRYPERFRAIDGKVVKPPGWWRAGASAWGCHQSHLQIMERAMMDDLQNVLILEDDVFFEDDFRETVKDFLDAVPNDWQQIYLGGQHLYQRKQLPIKINEQVCIPFNVNRTHAFALHRRGFRPVYQWLTDYVSHSKNPIHHIDHRLGELHGTRTLKVYAPVHWLAGQVESQSNINGRLMPSRTWNAHQHVDHTEPFVAVIGLHRSGSSALAGVLHKLGVHMGDRLGGYEKTGGYEAVGLSRICERAIPFPTTESKIQPGMLRYQLSKHIRHVQRSAKGKGKIAGGKYPHLCALGEDLKAVCGPGLKVIHINRPLEESISSLITRSKNSSGWLAISETEADGVQRWLWSSKQAFLSDVQHHTVEYHQLLRDPDTEIQRLIEYLGLSPSEAEVKDAISHMQPELATHLQDLNEPTHTRMEDAKMTQTQ